MFAMRKPWLFGGAVLVAALVSGSAVASAQIARPKAAITPTVAQASVRPGERVRLSLDVKLPDTVHVQADKPRDPSLIPTALTVTPPAGVTVTKITYPAASDLRQAGQKEPLAVFGHAFTITVDAELAANAAPGDLIIPARLRYQACDEAMCYPPAKADAQWTVKVR